MGAVRLGDHDGAAGIRGRSDIQVERNLAQEVDTEPARRLARAAMVEDLGAVAALGAHVVAHVFHDPEDRHVDLLEHVDAPGHVEQCDVLRGRDDHGAGERDPLRHGELRIAGARRQVAKQHVKLAPIDVAHHLLERLHDHRAAPDHGRVLGDEEPDRHALDPVIRHGAQRALPHQLRLAAQIEHARDRGAVNVAIEQADPDVLGGHCRGEVHGCRRLADSALARRDGDHALHAGQELAALLRRRLRLPPLPAMRVTLAVLVAVAVRLAGGLPFGGHHRRHREHAGQPVDRRLAGLAQRLLRRALSRVDFERKTDVAVPHHHTADQPAGDDVLPAVRVQDIGQRRQNLLLGD